MTIIELLSLVTPRLAGPPTCTLLEAVRTVQEIISNRLLLQRSNLLREELSLSFAAEVADATLDNEFYSVSERPFIAGQRPLSPLNRQDKASLQTPGDPRYYDIVGKTLWLYPPPDTAVTLKVPAFVRPLAPDGMADDLPFYGEFDSVFIEGCLAVMTVGLAAMADRSFVATIQSQVDQLLTAKGMADEQALADAINYDR